MGSAAVSDLLMHSLGNLLALLLIVSPGFVHAHSQKSLVVDYRVFPNLSAMDGNWAALLASNDGKVYAGLAYHGGNGHLVYYDSKQDRVVDAGDLTQLSGESNLRRSPQSKIHAKLGEGKDGPNYFGTHVGFWFDYSRFATEQG